MSTSKTLAWIERHGPAVVGVIAAGGAFATADYVKDFRELSAWGTLAFGFVAAGFNATQRNALISNPNSNVMRYAVRTGIYLRMLGYFNLSVYVGLGLVPISIVLFVVSSSSVWWKWPFALSIGMLIGVVALSWRNEMIASRVIQRYLEETAKSRERGEPLRVLDISKKQIHG